MAPAPLRIALVAGPVALVAYLVGGASGFWIGLPGILLAGSLATTGPGSVACALPVLVADAAASTLATGPPLPPLWLVILVPAGCLLVLGATGRRLRQERDAMQHAAFSDPLTGLANRRMLTTVAGHEIARHRRSDERLTVVMLDLDGFKLLNDRYGHAAGDQMLCAVAAALTRSLRSQDTVARLGGDEFCVIAPQTEDPRALTAKIVTAVAQAASTRKELQTSVGVAIFPEDGATIQALLRFADERLLSAKRRRHGGSQRRAA